MANVTVYTTSTCPYCTKMKNFLAYKGIPYKEVNLESNQQAVEKILAATGHMGVPQTEVNGKWVLGYDPNKLMELVEPLINN
ncbi:MULTISPECIES: glutaredoxin family protein [Bacillaceae]|uniref:glutaredoxin family protein n=1 Tax=Bacillaceae TaxID=186817 RepID=UPI001BDDCB96|nr:MULTISPECIES: glutaredoxin family protein [Bacillaceae]MDX8359190.1 glutaredoxin family protein [Cytobacillus sp. IB215316]MDX8367424.1 glutaredoxin family protein [Cytobacillus sp. IB215665]